MAYGQTNAPGASGALAKEALATAQNALGQAAAAQATAENAGTTANLALEKANAANTTASNAAGVAQNAMDKATSLEGQVTDAVAAAQAAADSAGAAQQAAQNAETAAQNAQTAADAALKQLTEMASTINAVPSQNGVLSYTGAAQSPTWNSYDPNTLTIGGTTSGTAAGTYTATFTPKEGYKWSDGTSDAKSVTWTIQKASLTVPSQKDTLTYTGSSQSPAWNNYDSAKLTIGGTTSGTNAGSYTATFTPKANYQWSDGTATAKSVTWTIGKAAGSLALSATALSLSDTGSLTGTVTVTRPGDGAISASSSNTNVAAVSVSGTTITVTGKINGSATITVSVGAGTNHTAPGSKTISVTVSVVSGGTAATSGVTYTSGISSLTPEKLTAYAKAISNNSAITKTTTTVYIDDGSSHYKISVGDSITVNFGSEARVMKIMGFNHYDLTDANAYGSATATGKAGILLQTEDCLNTTQQMNSSNTNSGGWGSTALRTKLRGDIKNSLSASWRSAIKSVRRKVSAGSQSTTINTVDDDLFVPTEVEVFGTTTYSVAGEGDQYAYYKAGNSKVKKVNGSAHSWWECSPNASTSAHFCFVSYNGGATTNYASSSNGVALGFCV